MTTDIKAGATPGPWTCTQGQHEGKPETWWDVDGAPEAVPDGDPTIVFPQDVCMVYGHNGAAEANARLIAAAPDLLAALKAVRETCPCDPDIGKSWQAAWNQMEAAIAKAEGAQ